MRKNACIREPQTVYKKFTSCTLSEARKKFTETYKHNPQPSSVNTWETKKKVIDWKYSKLSKWANKERAPLERETESEQKLKKVPLR